MKTCTFKAPIFFAQSGWRRTAILITSAEGILAVAFIAVLARSVSAAGTIAGSFVFFEGDCTLSSRINLALHLVINITSSCIVASSNYFMQILNAPTRQEVDRAHRGWYTLDIGVPSVRNLGHISARKRTLWWLFTLTSIPIHMTFNSAIFETDYQGSDFSMAIATEDFVNGADFYGPGASLLPPGGSPYSQFSDLLDVNLTDFLDQSSSAMRHIASISKSAKQWKRLEPHECRAQYGACSPRREWGDVVLIANSQIQGFNPPTEYRPSNAGFIIDHLYNWTEAALPCSAHNFTSSELRRFWDRYGPLDQPNPLWAFDQCSVFTFLGQGDYCHHECAIRLGIVSRKDWKIPKSKLQDAIDSTTTSWDIPMEHYRAVAKGFSTTEWCSSNEADAFTDDYIWAQFHVEERPTFNASSLSDAASLQITHCYAQPMEGACKVAASNQILCGVTVCVMLKVVLSVLVCKTVSGQPLITPGDALVSFIQRPDDATIGKASARLPEGNERARDEWVKMAPSKKWHDSRPPPIAAAIPLRSWVGTYGFMVPGIITTAILLYVASVNVSIYEDTGAFVHNQNIAIVMIPGIPLIGGVLLVNLPQIFLTFCYFAYNALITRACTEIEWNSYAGAYRPLRVSYPEQGQTQSYRLQLPYRFSIPLIATSILLHWLVSNAFYLSITEGTYLGRYSSESSRAFPDNASISIGFSTVVILITLLLCVVIAAIPLVLTRRLKGSMVICGNSSFAISAACHVSTRNVHGGKSSEEDGGIGMQPLVLSLSPTRKTLSDGHATQDVSSMSSGGHREVVNEDLSTAQILHHISTSKLRWGVVKMPTEWYDAFQTTGHDVEHLAFGTEEQDVRCPRPGTFYA